MYLSRIALSYFLVFSSKSTWPCVDILHERQCLGQCQMLKILLEQGHRRSERLRRNVYVYEAVNFSALGLSAPPSFIASLPRPPSPPAPHISILEDVHEHAHKNLLFEFLMVFGLFRSIDIRGMHTEVWRSGSSFLVVPLWFSCIYSRQVPRHGCGG